MRADKSRVTHIGKAVLEDIAGAHAPPQQAGGSGATSADGERLRLAEKKLEEAAAAEVVAQAAAKVNSDLETARGAAKAASDEHARQQAQLGAPSCALIGPALRVGSERTCCIEFNAVICATQALRSARQLPRRASGKS